MYVDREMWEKIVLNLLSNAFKFTFEGEIVVRVQDGPQSKAAELMVRDTGVGIPQAELPRLSNASTALKGKKADLLKGRVSDWLSCRNSSNFTVARSMSKAKSEKARLQGDRAVWHETSAL